MRACALIGIDERLFVMIMGTALDNIDNIIFDTINDAILVINATAPVSRKIT